MVARLDTEAVLLRAGSLLRLSRSDETGFDPERVVDKYVVEVGEPTVLDTGAATMLRLRERRADVLRERLFVDDNTGLVVRRETFHADGSPQRLVAFTDLRTRIRRFETMPGEEAEVRGDSRRISGQGVGILDGVGWAAPETLPGDYRLQAAYALPESEGSSLHLVYGDGLYTISVYQQRGTLHADALEGAEADTRDGMHHYTWPGAEPTRMVWSGDDLTFTAVTDAPAEHITAAVEVFPHASPPSLPRRMVRGLRRVADLLWPFA
jgi:sigma-E factor negative regulatory protein RseB